MEIKYLRKIENGGKLKAFFELHTDKIIIRDCKLFSSKDGDLFATMPSREYLDKATNQKKWVDIVRITDDALRDKITELAREEYFKGGTAPKKPEEDLPF